VFSLAVLAHRRVISLFIGKLNDLYCPQVTSEKVFAGLRGKDGKVPKHCLTLKHWRVVLQIIMD